VWAVGSRQTGDDGTLTEHWDGTRWSVVPSPSIPNSFSSLDGVSVASPTDGWAVGSAQNLVGTHTRALIEHWNGRRWSIVPSPDPGDYNFLSDVSARSADDAWAVGSTYDADGPHTLVLHWDGVSWTAVDAPSPGIEDDTLESVVALGRREAWAVGYSADDGVSSRVPLTLRWDGIAWRTVQSPSLSGQLTSVTAAPGGSLWAAGYREVPATSLVERWDGSAWHVVPSQSVQGAVDTTLFGISVDATGRTAWAVGSVARWDGTLRAVTERPCGR
jgi:hypothetical protein